MSRVGFKQIVIQDGVELKLDGNTVTGKSHKGELTRSFQSAMTLGLEDNRIHVVRPSDSKKHRALHGTTRSLINNLVVGVHEGFEKHLEINGVGYRAQKQGNKVVLNVGYSHPVEIEPEDGIEIDVPN